MQDFATICDITMECKIDFMLEKGVHTLHSGYVFIIAL
jgi:hypothetical protein